MQYVINEGAEFSEKIVEADFYDYRADNSSSCFWKEMPGSGRVAVYTMRLQDVFEIEAKPSV
jgi:hypothetical protein